jgi:hypothetical protein
MLAVGEQSVIKTVDYVSGQNTQWLLTGPPLFNGCSGCDSGIGCGHGRRANHLRLWGLPPWQREAGRQPFEPAVGPKRRADDGQNGQGQDGEEGGPGHGVEFTGLTS